MSTDPCDRCGESAPAALLRDVELRVDDQQVDEQSLCPDCFSAWIAHYRAELAGEMAAPEEREAPERTDSGSDITIADEEPVDDVDAGGDSVIGRAVQAAESDEGGPQASARGRNAGLSGGSGSSGSTAAGNSGGSGSSDIREVGGNEPPAEGGDDVEIDLDAETDHGDDEDDDDGGLLG